MANETQWRVARLPDGASTEMLHTWNDEPMKPARHLVFAEYYDGPMIYRYADDWNFSGDTGHENLVAALQYVDHEYGVSNLEWQAVSGQEATVLMTQGKRK